MTDNTVKMKFFENNDIAKKGEIVDVSTKNNHHLQYVKSGVAEIIDVENEEIEKIMEEKKCDREIAWKIYQQRKEIKDIEKRLAEEQDVKTDKILDRPKEILDHYKPLVIRKDKVYEKDGVAQVNTHEPEKYTPENYSTDIILQIPPKDAITGEFEDTPEKNKRFIAEMEEACRVRNIQYCVSSHGGKSEYIRIYNLKGIPVNYDNRIAKDFIIEELIPSGAKEQLDKTNLGWTHSPVIGHPHWKSKYNEAIHTIIRGTHPLDQVNEYPKELLKKIEKAKKQTKYDAVEILRKNQWVNDFLVNYCTNNPLPKGTRHYIIGKNLAALIYHRTDREEILNRYLKAQERTTNTLRTWFNAISGGQYTQVSVTEIRRYIQENNIDYAVPTTGAIEPANALAITLEKRQLLTDPKLLINIVKLVQSQGVVGEENTILTSGNKISLRLVKNHKPTSSNFVVSDLPGSGKDVIVQAITKVFVPPSKLIHRTCFSDKALEYFMINKPEDFTLNEHVFYLEDPPDDLLKSQAFRVMASGQNKVTVVKDQELLELEVRGKPVIIVTSMNATIDEEGGRRWDAVQTDTSEILTKLVIKEKLRQNTEGITWKKIPKLAQALHKLKPYEVIIPFADKLLPFFEKTPSLIMRIQVDKFLDYMKSSAVIHQFQREKDNEGRLIANDFDYEYAKFVFGVLGDAEGGMLNTIERKLVAILRNAGRPLSFVEICQTKDLARSKDWLYKHFDNLKSRRIVGETSEFDEKSNKAITKLYTDIGCSSIPLPHGSVLFGFIPKLENQNKDGFIGFINILKEFNEKRKENGLFPLHFEDLDEKKLQVPLKISKNHENQENLSVGAIIKPQENQIKPLSDKIQDLKDYCEKLKADGRKITYENFCFNFNKLFIEKCKENKVLIVLPDSTYDLGGN